MMHDQLLSDIAQATRLREGIAGVETILRIVRRSDGLRVSDVAREARLPLPVTTAIRRELEKRGVFQRLNGLSLTPTGQAWVDEVLGLGAPLKFSVPPKPQDALAPPLDAVLADLQDLLDGAPRADVRLDQAPCTAETAVRRAALLYRSGALEGRRIIMLGDDDSISLAVGLLDKAAGGRRLARRVTVLEIDPSRVAFLRRSAERRALPIEVVPHDLRDPLPRDLAGGFDTFETDPPYTLDGLRLFLSRGVEALEGGRGRGMLSFGHTAPAERLQLQACLAELGLATTALYPSFNRYDGAAILGSVSELYELTALSRHGGIGRWDGPLYTAELRPRPRAYRCGGCGKRLVLGEAGAPPTIGVLKERGCPVCGGHTFRRAHR